jgi:predicted PurR-regulated permease PerM
MSQANELPTQGPGSRKRRRIFLGVSGVLLVAVLVMLRSVLLPFTLGIVLAYVLAPLVTLGQRLRVGKLSPPRWAVVVVLYVTMLGLLGGLAAATAPRLTGEMTRLAHEAPRAVAAVRDRWLPEIDRRLRSAALPYVDSSEVAAVDEAAAGDAPSEPAEEGEEAPPSAALVVRPIEGGGYEIVLPPEGVRVRRDGQDGYRILSEASEGRGDRDLARVVTAAVARMLQDTERTALTVLQTMQAVVAALSRGVFAFVLMLMVSAFLLVTSDRIFDFVRSFYPPGRQRELDLLLVQLDRGLTGVVRGQLIICVVNGVLSGIGFYLLGLKYWVFLTLLAGVMSIIPIFGSILSTIPAVLVALPQGVGVALLVLGWIVAIHQLEANLLNPKIMGDSARVHPVLVVFALLAGEHVAGIMGALLAVPVLSITQTVFLYMRERALGVPRASSSPPPEPDPARAPASATADPAQT